MPDHSTTETLQTTCCIAGGGPAGMMLGFLLARAGVDVVVLEKHADFLRDFRGDTIHPSTLEIIWELGLLDEFLARPHQKIYQLRGFFGDAEMVIADFTHLPVHCPFLVIMPQWEFLNFLAEQGKKYPTFHLHMRAEATGLIEESGRITGVTAKMPEGTVEIRAPLVIGADGRHSTLRQKALLPVKNMGAPIDVLWLKVSRKPGDPAQPLGRFNRGQIFVMLYRDDYWQCAYVIAKGSFEKIRGKGLKSFQDNIKQVAPFLADRVDEITGWDDVRLLTVMVDHLCSWFRPGLLFIGDAAHAMSPIGGVGINLAIQDAVAAANILQTPLKENRLTEGDLLKVQKRRAGPARMTQRLQVFVQNRIFAPYVSGKGGKGRSWIMPAISHLPFIRRIPAYVVGIGFRPEHIRCRLAPSTSQKGQP